MDEIKCYLHYVTRHPTGTYGVLMDTNELPFAVTLQPFDKYFVEGEYDCHKRMFNHGGYLTFEIVYPEHSEVLFHKGNHQTDSKMCILVGEAYELVGDTPGIAQSGVAFGQFWDKYKSFDKFKLIVSHAKDFK